MLTNLIGFLMVGTCPPGFNSLNDADVCIFKTLFYDLTMMLFRWQTACPSTTNQVHKNRVCVLVFIRVSVHTCIRICVCSVIMKKNATHLAPFGTQKFAEISLFLFLQRKHRKEKKMADRNWERIIWSIFAFFNLDANPNKTLPFQI